ncbi:hypothetical protein VTK56DRAFT_3238 [Thermocarpiscus australiensis]
MPATRIPTEADFPPGLSPSLSLVYPTPRESTTAILLLFHGLGDSESPFASFARTLALPGVLAIAVRGTSPLLLPAGLLGSGPPSSDSASGAAGPGRRPGGGGPGGFHWGDDLRFSGAAGGEMIDPDPGFEKARRWVMERLIGEVLVDKCGWEVGDVMLFGFGQGGSFALGLASALRMGKRVEEITEGNEREERRRGRAFKGVVSVGGALPASMVPTVSNREKARTPVLVLCGRESEAVDEDAVDLLEREFADVKVVRWKRASDGMPSNREEALPMMQFFADRLRNAWL